MAIFFIGGVVAQIDYSFGIQAKGLNIFIVFSWVQRGLGTGFCFLLLIFGQNYIIEMVVYIIRVD